MTDTATSSAAGSADGAHLTLGHPVRSFVLVLLATGLLLLGIRASGAISPRIDAYGLGGGSTPEGRDWTSLEVRNDGFLPVLVESLAWPTSGVSDVTLRIGPPGVDISTWVEAADRLRQLTAFAPFTMEAGEVRIVVVEGRPTCAGSFATEDLTVHVRTWARAERTVRVGGRGNGGNANNAAPNPCG